MFHCILFMWHQLVSIDHGRCISMVLANHKIKSGFHITVMAERLHAMQRRSIADTSPTVSILMEATPSDARDAWITSQAVTRSMGTAVTAPVLRRWHVFFIWRHFACDIPFHFRFFMHGNPVKCCFSGYRDKTLQFKIQCRI